MSADNITAGSAVAGKLLGGTIASIGIGAGLSAIVVMCLTTPRSPREWAVGLICTVLGSVCGGAAVVQYFNLTSWMDSTVGLVAVLGLVFACGLPAWAIVRWTFTYIIRRHDSDIIQVADDFIPKFGARKSGGYDSADN